MTLEIVFTGLVLFVDISRTATSFDARLIPYEGHTAQLVVPAELLPNEECPKTATPEFRPQLVCKWSLSRTSKVSVEPAQRSVASVTAGSTFLNGIPDVGAILNGKENRKVDPKHLDGAAIEVRHGRLDDNGDRARCDYVNESGSRVFRDNAGGVRWLAATTATPTIVIDAERIQLTKADRVWIENEPEHAGDHFDAYLTAFRSAHKFRRSCYLPRIKQDPILCPPARATIQE